MKVKLILILFVGLAHIGGAQDSPLENPTTKNKNEYQIKENSDEIEANFLSSYYQQDGNNSAVTGGIGTEELMDFANILIVNIPLNAQHALSFYGGVDAYTSASTDNIDLNVSSASRKDVRSYATLSYFYKNSKRNEIYGLKAGYSGEFDYQSFSTGFTLSKEWNNGNTELNLNGQAFFDSWLGKEGSSGLIYPELWLGEALGYSEFTNPGRNSYNVQLNFSQVISPKLVLGVSAEMIYMDGLLSTPFHSVFFSDQPEYARDIERLPSTRLKLPFGARLNYFPLDFLVLRTYYRFYIDDFGINANTFEIETPVKVSDFITLSPFYRYHIQTASDYFAPYKEHLSTDTYYTSDYDLSALYSQKVGLSMKYYPLYGLLRSKPWGKDEHVFMLKYIELRAAHYWRSTGLSANNVSLNLDFSFK